MSDILNIPSENSYLTSRQWEEVVKYVKNRKSVPKEPVIEEVIEPEEIVESPRVMMFTAKAVVNTELTLYEKIMESDSVADILSIIQTEDIEVVNALTKNEIDAIFERIDILDSDGVNPMTEQIVDILISLPNFMSGAEEDGEEQATYDLLDDHTFSSDTTIDNAITIKYVDGNDANWQITKNLTITINDTITIPQKTYLDILCTDANITATIKAGANLGNKPMFVVQNGGILKIAKTTGESGSYNKGKVNFNGVTIQVEAGGKVYIENVNEIKGTCSWKLNGGEVWLYDTMPIKSGSLSITGNGTVKRVIHNDEHDNSGYMFEVDPSATLTVDGIGDSAYQNNWSSGVVIIDGGSMENVKSAIYCRGKFNLRDAVVKNNFANIDGGAISLGLSNQTSPDSVTVEISRALIENCTTTKDGGGIKLNGYTGGVITMTDSTVRNCSGRGGAIRTNGAGNAKMNITRCLLEGNHGTDHGGGVYWNANGKDAYLTITDSVIKGNTTKLKGGGLFLEGSNMSLTSSDIIGNSAQNGGGVSVNAYGGAMGVGMEATDSFNLAIGNGVTIKDNVATDNGGGIAMTVFSADPADGYTYNISIEDGAIVENNVATGNGGAIYTKLEYSGNKTSEYNMNVRINGGIINNNQSTDGNGGAIYLERTYTASKKTFRVHMGGGIVISNHANNGGAVHIKGGNFSMSGGSMQGNTSVNNGGAVHIADGNADIESGNITNNIALDNGGAICVTSGNITIGTEECHNAGESSTHSHPVIKENIASDGGGLYVNGGSTTMWCGGIKHNKTHDKTVNVLVANGDFTYNGGSIGVPYDTGVFVTGGVFDDNVSEAESVIKHELHYHSVLGDETHNGRIPESKWITSPRGDILHKEDCDETSPTWADLFPEYEFVGWESHGDDTDEVVNLYAIWEKK